MLLGFPDTTQDAHLFVDRTPENGAALVSAIRDLGFDLAESQAGEIVRGKGFVQLKNGPFDLDPVFATDGIEHVSNAWARRVDVEGFPVCHPDDIIASKAASNRVKDRESRTRCAMAQSSKPNHSPVVGVNRGSTLDLLDDGGTLPPKRDPL